MYEICVKILENLTTHKKVLKNGQKSTLDKIQYDRVTFITKLFYELTLSHTNFGQFYCL